MSDSAYPTRVDDTCLCLSITDAACERAAYEEAILATARNEGRLALVGYGRQGKSTLLERTLAAHKLPVLRRDFHKALSLAAMHHSGRH